MFIKWGQIIRKRKLITIFIKGVIKESIQTIKQRSSNHLHLPWESTSPLFGGSGLLTVTLLYKFFFPFLLSFLSNVTSGFSFRPFPLASPPFNTDIECRHVINWDVIL